MAKKAKGGLAILIAGKPAGKDEADDTTDYPEDMGPPPDDTGALPEEDTGVPPEPDYAAAEEEYPEFEVPEGVDLSDMGTGDEKEVLATIRMKEGGMACITKIEGVDIASGAPELPPEAPPEEMPAAPIGGGGGLPPDIGARARGAGLM
jgi:hypothetical protein